MTTRNLDAYYYSFEPTGCDEVDAILEQVAQAGAGYHSTADWQDKYADGSSPTSNMQRAAEESAAQINIIIAERDQLKAESEALRKTHASLQGVIKLTEIPREGAPSQLDLLRKDAERYRWLRDQKPNAFHLERNTDHTTNYMPASEWIDVNPDWFHGAPAETISAMKEAETIWQIQIYPNTPVGFHVHFGATLDQVIDACRDDGVAP